MKSNVTVVKSTFFVFILRRIYCILFATVVEMQTHHIQLFIENGF